MGDRPGQRGIDSRRSGGLCDWPLGRASCGTQTQTRIREGRGYRGGGGEDENLGRAGHFFSRAARRWVRGSMACGTAGFPWRRFLFWDALGETTGAATFIFVGRIFSDRVMAMDAVLRDITWALLALVATVFLGYKVAYGAGGHQAACIGVKIKLNHDE